MFVENGGNVQNWLGKFGAYSSHKLMYNTFGLSSIAFCTHISFLWTSNTI